MVCGGPLRGDEGARYASKPNTGKRAKRYRHLLVHCSHRNVLYMANACVCQLPFRWHTNVIYFNSGDGFVKYQPKTYFTDIKIENKVYLLLKCPPNHIKIPLAYQSILWIP